MEQNIPEMPPVYEPPMVVEVGEFSEDTLGYSFPTIPDATSLYGI